ncbi:MAG: hypothetical protein GWP63_15175 [Haliea sp.]|jgi:hypothetical protein|nr:hypothetical protein [Haliea sp.]
MNWDAIGATAEMLAAFGVIVSLLYLARQTRKNTSELARSNSRQTYADHATALRPMVESAELCDLVVRGQLSRDDLDVSEQYRFDLVMGNWLQAVEQAFADNRDGNFPSEFMHSHYNNVPAYLNTPGGTSWWNARKVWFSKAFQQEVEKLMSNPSPDANFAGINPHVESTNEKP